MNRLRRTFLKSAFAAAGVFAGRTLGSENLFGADMTTLPNTTSRVSQPPLLNLHARFDHPIEIRSIDALQIGGSEYVRVTSAAGDVGIAPSNGRLLDLLSLFKRRVAPFFVGKDARDLENLLDKIYLAESNYKFAGMPWWCAVAHVELAVLDLLAKSADKPVGALLGPVIRKEIPVYLTRLVRDTSAEEEIEIVAGQLARCRAEGVKLKIGGRMKNDPPDARRTDQLIPLARKVLGDKLAIYVDANGSYTVDEAIAVGKMLQVHGVGFFEEPCPWEEYDDTLRVAEALEIPIAAGEQDTSLARFRWMIGRRAVDLVQPDIYYLGGLIRSLRVARMAQTVGLPVTPHSPKTGGTALPMLHFASVVSNLGPHQEYAFSAEIKDGKVAVPTVTGLGMSLDETALRRAVVL